MATHQEKIGFEHKGIGAVLSQSVLAVPPNQREYSWEEEHITDLLQDFAHAIDEGPVVYFLGTLVLTASESGIPEVADGQQRLATTTMILAAIRDYFYGTKNPARVEYITKFLRDIDPRSEQTIPKLRLNVDDSAFFTRHVLLSPDDQERLDSQPTRESHHRIVRGAKLIREYFDKLLTLKNASARADVLLKWVEFIRDLAQVIQLLVPDHMNAFMMFETLNDRGLKASQADLLKNYLFSHANDRMDEAQQRWAKMLGTLESLGDEEIVMDYLRHSTICQHGPTKEKEVFEKIRGAVNSNAKALDFLGSLETGAGMYSALFNADHPFWNAHGTTARAHVRTMIELRISQIRPLMFAIIQRFSVEEVRKALKMLISWSVRFLIVGGRGGLLDINYAQMAVNVWKGVILDAYALSSAMNGVVPNDAVFEAVFAEARVSQAFLARYYLRALEKRAADQPEPEWVPNSEDSINLEHVLPETPGPGWAHIDDETAAAFYKRLGNMVLLPAKKNVGIGNDSFADKKTVLSGSGYVLTVEVGRSADWGVTQIIARQKRLAQLAVETWPLPVSKPTKGGKLPKKKP
jgi:Protein of unknown function DUF262/Protein of unknown function (DUF1524)